LFTLSPTTITYIKALANNPRWNELIIMYTPQPESFIWESHSTATDGKQYPDIETHSAQPPLPDENFNKKPNNSKKRPNRLFKGQ